MAERRIGELQIERAAAIEQAEGGKYVSAVARINTELAHLGASVVAHRDRVAAMERRCHQQALARREQERQAGIADVRKRLGKRSASWAELHSKGFPSSDINTQAVARTEQQWNTFFAGLRAQWSVTPEQEAEMRGGVVREEFRNWALEQRDLMVKDKAFYRRFLDGDMAAKEKWGRVVALIALRPVKAA